MNRVFILPMLATLLVWLVLYVFVSGDDTGLNRGIAAGVIATCVAVAVHMLYDRRLQYWTLFATGVFIWTWGWAFLVSFLQRDWLLPEISRGVREGWLDGVRACLIMGIPLIAYGLFSVRIRRVQTGEPVVPGQALIPDNVEFRTRGSDWGKEASS